MGKLLSLIISLFFLSSIGCGKSESLPGKSESQATKTDSASPAPKAKDAPPPRPPGSLPSFTEISKAAGIVFERNDDHLGQHRILEVNGGGVALFDYDGDGWIDILFTDGCRLPIRKEDDSPTLVLFRNLGRNRYERVTLPAGLVGHGYYYGCAVADFNSDGFDDLYVTAFGRNSFWENNGDGTFSEITQQTGTACDSWSSSAAFADINADGILDLYVTSYVKYSAEKPRLCPDPKSPDGYTQCPPTMFRGVPDFLYLGDGAGGYSDVTIKAGITGVDGKGLGVVVFDANLDGHPDIFVTNDGMPNFLYTNKTPLASNKIGDAAKPLPKFTEEAMLSGVGINAVGTAEACMGVACGDFNADGRPDLYVTNFYSETNTLYQNLKKRFVDNTPGSGAGVSTRLKLGWGAVFLDFDNTGWLDLFVSNGHIDDFSWRGSASEPYQMHPQLFRNEKNDRFLDVSQWSGPYFLRRWIGRGTATGDLDNDGDIDLVVSHQRVLSAVLRNDSKSENKSVVLKLVGCGRSNRTAIGARVEATGLHSKLMREVIGGGSFQSASDHRVHIGLGKRKAIPKLKIRWPSGAIEERDNLEAGIYVVVEGRGVFRVFSDR